MSVYLNWAIKFSMFERQKVLLIFGTNFFHVYGEIFFLTMAFVSNIPMQVWCIWQDTIYCVLLPLSSTLPGDVKSNNDRRVSQ